jgi:hypothetical protein
VGGLTFILAALAVYRVSRMLTDEEGPWSVFMRLRARIGAETWLSRLFECIMCMSVWVALPVALWIDWTGEWALTWLALSAVVVIIRKWEQKK